MKRGLTLDTINPRVKHAKYAVRGAIVQEAAKIARSIGTPEHEEKHPGVKEVIYCNIGNPQQLRQRPITFFRQVLSLIEYPDLFQDPEKLALTRKLYPSDAIERAQALLSSIGVSTGAYSSSQGILDVRKHVAEFIGHRDGVPADPEDIFLIGGASVGVRYMMQCIIDSPRAGVLIPIPQYPLYSATLELLGGTLLGYELDEENGWGLRTELLQSKMDEHVGSGGACKALVVINPGNPTGQCLSRENMEDVIKFCHKNGLCLLADEVYQTNTYREPFWISFRKVLVEMDAKYHDVQVVSFHSTSKGVVGECGKRGGYMHLHGFDEEVRALVVKLASISLCPNVLGQCMVDLMVKPPQPGDASYEQYHEETTAIFESLKRRSATLAAALNELEGVTCSTPQGAMYLFPNIVIPSGAANHAASIGVAPDYIYAQELLRNTGICSVPGSGFKQKNGTFHVRLTFLPPEDAMDSVADALKTFHQSFLKKYKEDDAA